MEQKYYVAYHKNEQVLRRSSSGGAFTAITDAFFEFYGKKASVYGCILTDDFSAKHFRATTKDSRNLMCGSKYIGSNMSGVFPQIEKDLKGGFFVCFSGTPCQVDALKSYLNAKRVLFEEKLLTIDFVCHGISSTRFFKDYILHLEKKYRSKAIKCTFRSKSRPGKRQEMSVFFKNGRRYISSSTKLDWFFSLYNENLLLRPSCYQCKYATMHRSADITIADMWQSSMQIEKAQSTILVNTPQGNTWIEKAFCQMNSKEVSSLFVMQPQMLEPCHIPENKEIFWQIYKMHGYLSAQRWFGNNTFSGKAKSLAAAIIYHLHLDTIIKKLLRKQ